MAKQTGPLPWFKYRPRYWRASPAIRRCSLAARGLVSEMLSLMHEGEPYGHLAFNGKPLTPADLAQQSGVAESEVREAWAEIEAHRVFPKAPNGAYYCEQMIADRKRSISAARRGLMGGNPRLRQDAGTETQSPQPTPVCVR